MILEKLKSVSTLEKLIEEIRNFYKSFDEEYYIPAIFKEGTFTYDRLKISQEQSSDFYMKLIVRPQNFFLNKTWIVPNLQSSFIDGYEVIKENNNNPNEFVYNVITLRNIYEHEAYAYNPILFDENSNISEENYKNDLIVNNIFDDGNNRAAVLKKYNENLQIYKTVLKPYMQESKSSNYSISVEFEYRNTDNHILDGIDKISDEETFVENTSYIKISNPLEKILWVNGTIDIQINIKKQGELNIITNSISGNQRPINENNYNDDTDAGLIVFNYECIDYLKLRYIIIGMHMLDSQSDNSYLIDTFEDKVVFWEGEFNKLPYNVKKHLEVFNNHSETEEIISKAMFEWQLGGNWDVKKYMTPLQRLSDILLENYKNLVLEFQCNLVLPNSTEIFAKQASDILNITKLKLDNFLKEDIKNEDANLGLNYVKRIVNLNFENIENISLPHLFQHFCELILKELDNKHVN